MPQRPIKFRAWHRKANKMFSAEQMGKDQLMILPDTGQFINVSSVHVSQSQIIDDMIPLQFTGQHDDRGKEIYEHDIVRDHMDEDSIAVVWYDETEAAFVIGAEGNQEFLDGDSLTVIGNRYEDPELLSHDTRY